ncbi:metal-sulfur cluster assembly factor [candidate division KSB1 bacterium]|nr:metal-sulfur cluster assembly factor [candidate division KSB1 bacterium]
MPLKNKIESALRQVIDPETSLDVMRMQLVKNLKVDEDGSVSLTFIPSSPYCPLGFQLAISIQNAIKQIEGVTDIHIEVDGYVHAEALKKILAENASD